MKTKLFLGLAAVALATVSCTSDDVLENEIGTKRAIGFSSYVNGTRAYTSGDVASSTGTGVTAITEGSFGVVGYHNDDTNHNIYLGAEATTASDSAAIKQTYSNSAWDYATTSELKYWPATGKMDFYAYFPYASTTKVKIAGANGSSTTPLEITSWTDGQDVLVASATGKSYEQTTSLQFAHAFAKIKGVTLTKADNGAIKDYSIIVNEVQFLNTETTGSIKVANDGTISYGSAQTKSIRKKSLTSAVTASSTVANLIENSSNAYIFPISNTTSGQTTTIHGTGKTIWNGTKTDNLDLTSAGQVVMVLKAKVYKGTDYIVGSSSADGVIYIPLSTSESATTIVAGKRYTFNITMKDNAGYDKNGNAVFRPIKFSVSVNDWDESNTTVNITL